jgi:TRAP-type transport system periplasmic protein
MKKLALILSALCFALSLAFAQDDPITLRLAVADAEYRPSTPFVLEFIERVNTLSSGSITIEPIYQAGNDTFTGFETGVVQLVLLGKADLGLAGSRAFDTVGITDFQALQAPFLITDDAMAKAVATSDIAARMLDGVAWAGIVGLTLWPEDLRHPFAFDLSGKTFLSPEDFAGTTIRAIPSSVTWALLEALGATPIFKDGYGPDIFAGRIQGAESGLRQGASLPAPATATGNVVFFPKFQVLFANGAAFERLSDEQRSVLREAAARTQERAIAEHPRQVDAAAQWCADGGTIVMASNEQIAAFEEAARPVFDQIEQDPLNAELIAAIRDLKASTEPSPGAEACAPEAATTHDQTSPELSPLIGGQIPPELVGTWSFNAFGRPWKVELTADGTFSLYEPNGILDIGGSYSIVGSEAVFRDEKRGTGKLCVPAEGRYHWELIGERLMFTVIEDKCTVGRIEQWTAGWQKVEQSLEATTETQVWSEGLPPNGTWQTQVSVEDFMAMGVMRPRALGQAGIYTFTLQGGQGLYRWDEEDGDSGSCEITYSVVEDFVRLVFPTGDCGPSVDELKWRLDENGLHFHLVTTDANYLEVKTMYETRPWRKVD